MYIFKIELHEEIFYVQKHLLNSSIATRITWRSEKWNTYGKPLLQKLRQIIT